MKSITGEKVFNVVNYIGLGLISICALYPFIYVLSAALSSGDAVQTGKVLLLPKEFNLYSFQKVLSVKGIWVAYGNTIFYTIAGTLGCMLFSVAGAYALSKERLMGRKFFAILLTLTMWLKAGIVPEFLNFRALNLYNTRSVPIVGFLIVAFNVILLRTYFESIPKSLEESAQIDGASDLTILAKIYLPLAKPGLATVSLFYAVNKWNGYFWSMILLRDENKVPLQVLLRKLIVEMNATGEFMDAVQMSKLGYSTETIVYATIIISIIPIVLAYPFIQKYFAKGAMIGAVKG